MMKKTIYHSKIGNPNHWFGNYYLGGTMGSGFILYSPTLKKTIELKAKSYQQAIKEAHGITKDT